MAPSARPADPKASTSRSLRNLAGALLFGVLALAGLVLYTGGKLNLEALRAIKLPYLVACLGLVILDWVSEAVRLTLLSRALGERVGLLAVLRVVFMGAFFARITPFDSGGEPVQVYALHQSGVSLGHATATVAVKAILHGLARVSLGILVPVWLVLTSQGWRLGRAATIALYAGMGIYLGVTGLIVLAILHRGSAKRLIQRIARSRWVGHTVGEDRAERFIERLEGDYRAFIAALKQFGSERRNTIYLVGVISFLSWAAVLAVPVILVRALGGASPVAELTATAIIFYLAVAYAPTPGSAGASELGFAALFARFVPLPLVGVLVLAWRLLTHYLALILGFAVTGLSMLRNRPAAVPGDNDPGASASPGETATDKEQPPNRGPA